MNKRTTQKPGCSKLPGSRNPATQIFQVEACISTRGPGLRLGLLAQGAGATRTCLGRNLEPKRQAVRPGCFGGLRLLSRACSLPEGLLCWFVYCEAAAAWVGNQLKTLHSSRRLRPGVAGGVLNILSRTRVPKTTFDIALEPDLEVLPCRCAQSHFS